MARKQLQKSSNDLLQLKKFATERIVDTMLKQVKT